MASLPTVLRSKLNHHILRVLRYKIQLSYTRFLSPYSPGFSALFRIFSSPFEDFQLHLFRTPGFSALPYSRILSSFIVQDSQLFHILCFSSLPHSRISAPSQSRILISSTLQDSQLFHSPGFSALSQFRIHNSSIFQVSQLFHSP
jgi:hypothetical protein